MKTNFEIKNVNSIGYETGLEKSIENYLNEDTLMCIFTLEDPVSRTNALNVCRNQARKDNRLPEFEKVYNLCKKKSPILQKHKNYLVLNSKNELTVNTSYLAEYIRRTYPYFIASKKGCETFLIYWYDHGYYKQISSNELKAKIKSFIPLELAKPSIWENVYKDLISTDNTVKFEELNADENLINFKNGILNVDTNEFFNHDPRYRFTLQLNCEYHPNVLKKPTSWLNYIETLTNGDEELAKTLQEWFGLTISNYNGNICKKALVLFGPGNTGKSKYLSAISLIIGESNVCSTPIQELSDRFGAASLYDSKAILIDDQSSKNLEDSSIFKSITGSGQIKLEMKGKNPFTYLVKSPICFACNILPFVKDDKGSHLFERFLIIPCENVVSKERQNKRLLEDFQKEKNEIILWAIQGLMRLKKNNFNLTESQASIDANIEYRSSNDSFFKFINEKFEMSNDKDAKIKKTDLENEYLKYCAFNNIQALDKKNIIERAKINGIVCKKTCGIFHYFGLKRKVSI